MLNTAPEPIDFGTPLSVQAILDRAVTSRPTATALVGKRGRLRYDELDRTASQVASSLNRAGVVAGTRVAVSLPNDLPIVVTALALWKIGAVFVGMSRAIPTTGKTDLIAQSGAELLIGDSRTVGELSPLRSTMPELRRIVQVDDVSGQDEWEALVDGGDAAFRRADIDPLALGAIAYTSGTTGSPKGVMHSQHGLLLPAAVTAHRGSVTPDDPVIVVNPLTTLNILITNALVAFAAVSKCVLTDRHDAASIAAQIERERAACMSTVPTIYYDLLADEQVLPSQLASMTKPRVGGAPMSEAMKDLFASRFGGRPSTSYALTEAPAWVSRQEAGDDAADGTCGRPLPHIKVVILDEEGRAVEPGVPGEICFGPHTTGEWAGVYRPMLGYLSRPDESAEALRDGLFHSGDVGMLDEQGELFLLERRSQMIIRGGSNIFPSEIERVLIDDDDVRLACVVPRPDERLGEVVVAFVEPVQGRTIETAALYDRCRRDLAAYKVPSEIHVVTEMPLTPLGKVNRSQVHQLLSDARFSVDDQRASSTTGHD